MSQGVGRILATVLKPFGFLISMPSLQSSLLPPSRVSEGFQLVSPLLTPLPASQPSCLALSLLLQFEHAALRARQVKLLMLPSPVLFHC